MVVSGNRKAELSCINPNDGDFSSKARIFFQKFKRSTLDSKRLKTWAPGNYKLEIWQDNQCLKSINFEIY
jgi:hypothetical protein